MKDPPEARAAIASFEQVLSSDNDLHAAAHWYLAMAALRAEDATMARQHLEELVKADTYKRDASRALLEALAHE